MKPPLQRLVCTSILDMLSFTSCIHLAQQSLNKKVKYYIYLVRAVPSFQHSFFSQNLDGVIYQVLVVPRYCLFVFAPLKALCKILDVCFLGDYFFGVCRYPQKSDPQRRIGFIVASNRCSVIAISFLHTGLRLVFNAPNAFIARSLRLFRQALKLNDGVITKYLY